MAGRKPKPTAVKKLTPSARTRIMAASGAIKDDEDEMEALLGGGS